MTPLLAGIVAFSDTNANLDILDDNSDEWVVSMWLEMLDNADITMLRFKLVSPFELITDSVILAAGRHD